MIENLKRIALTAAVVGGAAVAFAVYAHDRGSNPGPGHGMMAPGMMQGGGTTGMMQDGGMAGMMAMMAKMGPMMDACTRMMESMAPAAPSGPESKKQSFPPAPALDRGESPSK